MSQTFGHHPPTVRLQAGTRLLVRLSRCRPRGPACDASRSALAGTLRNNRKQPWEGGVGPIWARACHLRLASEMALVELECMEVANAG